MRILFLCSDTYRKRKVPRTRFDAVDAMSKTIDVIHGGCGVLGWHDSNTIYNNLIHNTGRGGWPDAILVYKPEDYHGWDDPCLPPVVTTFNDAWATEQRTKDIRLPRAKLVIMHHANEVEAWRTRCPDVRFVHIPYGINPEIFKDYGLEKDIDILLTGAIDNDIYPLRAQFRRLIQDGAFAPYHAVMRPHPGYRIDSPHDEAVDYARMLNRAKICLADTSKYGYVPEKFMEIAACRSVVCSNMPEMPSHLVGTYEYTLPVCIPREWPDDLVVSAIGQYLRRANLDDMAHKSMEYIHGNHTSAHYARRFIAAVEEMLAAE